MTALTQARLKELLHYDPETGVWLWMNPTCSRMKPGDVAGTFKDGYLKITVDGHQCRAHRLAFLYMTGRWPVAEVDHRNCDRADNRWANLREATHAQNCRNTGPRATNTSGFMGVRWHARGRRWQARIHVDGREIYLGLFDTPEAAHAAYCAAAHQLHGQFARTA